MVLIRSLLSPECATSKVDIASTIAFLNTMEQLLERPFARVTFQEAQNYLNVTGMRDFSRSEEQSLIEWTGGRPLFLTHFPVALKPFYCQSKDEMIADCVDLLMPGLGELVGGSVREVDMDRLESRLIEQRSSGTGTNWYLTLNQPGLVPHAGFGLGFERFIQYALGIGNIRDTVAFPRTCDKIFG